MRHELVAARRLEAGRAEIIVLQAHAATSRAQAHQRAAAAQTAARIERAERTLVEARAHARRTLDQLDRMTGLHAPRWPTSPGGASTAGSVCGPADPLSPPAPADPHPESATRWTGDTAGRPVRAVPDIDEPPRENVWMGPEDGRLPLAVPRWLSYPLIVLLACAEFPIYFEIFRAFHPRDVTQRQLFTAAVTLAMVVGPHVAGVFVRHRHERPLERVAPVAAAALLIAWAAATGFFGYLRQSFLLGQDAARPGTRSQLLGLSPVTVTVVFTLVLIISGLIAFLLGIGHEHPGQKAYRCARRSVHRAERAHARALRKQRRHQEAEWRSGTVEEARLRAPYEHRRRVLLAEFRAAEAAYLDAVAKELASPTVTVAIGTYLAEQAGRGERGHGNAGLRSSFTPGPRQGL